MISYIYKIKNLINGKIYIGKTNNLKKRFKNHLYDAFNTKKPRMYNSKLYRSIRENGKKNFTYEPIAMCESEDVAYKAEVYFILLYDSQKNGLNTSQGGKGGISGDLNCSKLPENRKKISNRMIGENNPMSKLTVDQVKEIKKLILEGKKNIEIINTLKISKSLVAGIRSGELWNSVGPIIYNDGMRNKGSKNGMCKFSEEEIKNILILWKNHKQEFTDGWAISKFHKTYIKNISKISVKNLSDILHGKRWKYLYNEIFNIT